MGFRGLLDPIPLQQGLRLANVVTASFTDLLDPIPLQQGLRPRTLKHGRPHRPLLDPIPLQQGLRLPCRGSYRAFDHVF